ncbi:MAG: fimbrial assembly protein, partial [Pseudomonadota bacterium]|nr:fimbrial assembly protein [Pseudomonadota bacterium]
MIQQVNLYTQELRPRKERLQAGTLAGLVVLALLAVAVAAGMVRHEAAELDERVDAMVAENLRLEQRITDLSAQVQARQPSPD